MFILDDTMGWAENLRLHNMRVGPDPLFHRAAKGYYEESNMRSNLLVFAVFAAAMLFSMVREWSAPVGCIRPVLVSERITIHR